MAITNTRTVQRLEVYPGDTPTIMVVYQHTFDDTEDAELPVTTTVTKHLVKEVTTVDEEGVESTVVTDVSTEDPLVQSVANGIWS